MLVEETIKSNIKAKLLQARNNTTDADEALDALVEAIYIIVSEMLTNATVTGICPSGGGALTLGKIL